MNLFRWFPYKIRLLFDPAIDNVNITVYSRSLSDDAAIVVRQLGEVQDSLRTALAGIESVRVDALERTREAEELRDQVAKLNDDQQAAEAMLSVSEESVARLIARANRRGAWKGRIEGVVIGFLSGVSSSILVWWFTK